MKNIVVLFIVAIGVLVSTTAFQCGSAEMTSGKMYIQRQEWANAERSFEQEVAKHPNNAEAWYWLGRVRHELKNYKGMNEAFKRSLALSREFEHEITNVRLGTWGQFFNSGVGAFLRSKSATQDSASILLKEAIDHFTKAIEVNPDSASTYTNLGLAYLSADDFDNAASNFEIAVHMEKSGSLALQLGALYLDHGRKLHREAQSAGGAKKDSLISLANGFFDKAIVVTQKGEEYALNELRGIEAKIKDIVATGKDSRAELSELEVQKAELEKALAALTGTRLDSYVAAGRMDEARSSLKQAVEKNPQNKLYRFNYGVLLLKEGNHSAAVEQFEAAVTVDPTFEDALYNLGIANLQWGGKRRSEAEAATRGDKQKKIDRSYEQQFNKGKEALERLRDLKPNDPDVWEALGQAYANLNMAKAAEEAFKKADALRQGK